MYSALPLSLVRRCSTIDCVELPFVNMIHVIADSFVNISIGKEQQDADRDIRQ